MLNTRGTNSVIGTGTRALAAIGVMLLAIGCNGADFSADDRATAAPPPPDVTTTTIPTTVTTKPIAPTPECRDGQQRVGAHVAFLVDNSNSNSDTDCPNRRRIGSLNGSDIFECGSATNRETATLAAFDTLARVRATAVTPGEEQALATSRMAVASFPATSNGRDGTDGWELRTRGGWLNVDDPARRAELGSSMSFTRRPGGMTPYGAAVDAARALFRSVPDDGKAKVAVLVTDGEPTDRDPVAVAEASADLARRGIELVTVFVTRGETRSQRVAKHTEILRTYNTNSVNQGRGTWFASRYQSFEAYIANLLGSNGTVSLLDRLTGRVDRSCQDTTGALCPRLTVEVADSAALTSAFERVITTRAISCKDSSGP